MKAGQYHLNLALLALLLAACGAGPLLPTSSPTSTLEAEAADLLPSPAASTPASPALPPASPTPQAAVQEPPLSPSPTTIPSLVIPDPSGYDWLPVASGLERPLGLAHAGDGSGRLFIVEQGGRILIWQGGVVLSQPFLDLGDQVDCCGERGLLGLAFHPAYRQNGYFFVNYTERSGGALYSVIARYQVSADPNQAAPASELRLLRIPQPYDNHNGGHLAFGPDGFLYAGLGDGGSAGDPLGSGQALDTLLGNSVTGGCVYRGLNLPEWQGVYIYGDFASGRVWGLLHRPDGAWQNEELFDTAYLIASFGEDEHGEIYLLDYNGQILRLARR